MKVYFLWNWKSDPQMFNTTEEALNAAPSRLQWEHFPEDNSYMAGEIYENQENHWLITPYELPYGWIVIR